MTDETKEPEANAVLGDQNERVVSLGDLYADVCVICGARGVWGIANKSGPGGCVHAIKTGRTYCKNDLPEIKN